MSMRRGYRLPMNRVALKRDGAIGRWRTQNQVDGEISVNRQNRKPFIGFAQNANIRVYVGIHEKWLGEAPAEGSAAATVYEGYGTRELDGFDPTPHEATCR